MRISEFKWRSFISFSLFLTFLIMSISGLILYVAPPGRVFRWTDWHFILLDLSQWQSVHTVFSYCFLIAGTIHLFTFNWKIFTSYISTKVKKGINRKRELIISTTLVLFVLTGSLMNWQPFKFVMNVSNIASDYWGKSIDYPPVPHAEDMQLEQIAKILLNISGEEFVARIKAAGFKVEKKNQTLQEVCTQNKVVPYVLFQRSTMGLHVTTIPSQ